MRKLHSIDVLKYKYASMIASLAFIVIGILFALIFHGFNLGIDFSSGYSERIQIAPLGLRVAYNGDESAILAVSSNSLELQRMSSSGVTIIAFEPSKYPHVSDLAVAMREAGLSVEVVNGELETARLVSGFGFPTALTSTYRGVNFATPTQDVRSEDIRLALSEVGDVKVQTLGSATDGSFQIRLNTEGRSQEEVDSAVNSALKSAFGQDSFVVMQSDFVGPKFSSSLVRSSLYAILLAIVLMLVYITIRFRISYAISSIVALIHDVLMMLSLIMIFRFEVSSTTIAAILTIIGYSLNNTIVIFDRIRENVKKNTRKSVEENINLAVRQSFTRTMITSITTLLAIIPLAIFSTGDIKLFAINLSWGIVVGAYSSNFIAPGVLSLLHRVLPIDKIKEKKDEGDLLLKP